MKFPRIPYWYLAIGPYLLVSLGFALNALVMAFNGGQMPVLWPGGCDVMHAVQDAVISAGGSDSLHSCMTHSSHLKFLADWIVIKGVGIASPGDFLEWAYEATYIPAAAIWAAFLIKDCN
jgi:hypothetical protein